ncbi:MAG: hypothetical protein HOU81_09805 [Hamadaea sp.]|uniref:hypothetical protein n=1 Tax=Hamadaea sp. TaxID=2024425 RepID=UPI001796E13C|nr:hypothetical protein [Hamadaea sp.]NUR71104.1 hypothetical protein [Hamadaea sp.]NUT17952.1 hypothetical protein [Hamadaea sp.]
MDLRFLARLARFDPQALVRVRPAGPNQVALWGRLPWGVLVTRTAEGFTSADRTFAVADLLAGAEHPRTRDSEWRWALPSAAAKSVELLPAQVVRDIARAAAETLRQASTGGVGGQAVGSRRLRDALLDHVAITVTVDAADWSGRPIEVPQRLVQAVTRMGLLDTEDVDLAARDATVTADAVDVVVSGPWIGLSAPGGIAWYRPSAPTLRPL